MKDHRRVETAAQPSAHTTAATHGAWLLVLRRYLLVIVTGNLVWEFCAAAALYHLA